MGVIIILTLKNIKFMENKDLRRKQGAVHKSGPKKAIEMQRILKSLRKKTKQQLISWSKQPKLYGEDLNCEYDAYEDHPYNKEHLKELCSCSSCKYIGSPSY